MVLGPEDATEDEICINIEVKEGSSYAGYAIYEHEIQSIEDLGW